MCHNYAKHFFLILLCVAIGYKSFSQTSTTSNPTSNRENAPYSRYGIGEETNGSNAVLRGMGNISTAYSNPYSVNSDNPASYAGLKLTTYEGAGTASVRGITAGGDTYRTGMATFSYLTVGIPMGKYLGMAFGFRPQSRVYYRINDSVNVPGMGPSIYNYSGEGGLNYAYIGLAGQYKGFSIGFNFGYMFGTTRNSTVFQANTADTLGYANSYNTEYSRYEKVGGIYWKGGAMYETALSKNTLLRLGATISISQKLTNYKDDYLIAYHYSTDSIYQDTITANAASKGNIVMPLSFSVGAHLAGVDKWDVGIDFTSTQWTQFRNFGVADSNLVNNYKVNIGGEYTPNYYSRSSYLQRITYRVGFVYGLDYVKVNGTDINYYAVSLGASLPFKRTTDHIHTALEFGTRGTTTNGLVKENFVRFTLGVSLNDKWFVKRRYD